MRTTIHTSGSYTGKLLREYMLRVHHENVFSFCRIRVRRCMLTKLTVGVISQHRGVQHRPAARRNLYSMCVHYFLTMLGKNEKLPGVCEGQKKEMAPSHLSSLPLLGQDSVQSGLAVLLRRHFPPGEAVLGRGAGSSLCGTSAMFPPPPHAGATSQCTS